MPNKERGRLQLYQSTMDWGDFARYVVGDSYSFPWSSRPLRGRRPPYRKEVLSTFEKSLNKAQREAWNKFQEATRNIARLRQCDAAERREVFKRDVSNKELDALFSDLKKSFAKLLRAPQA